MIFRWISIVSVGLWIGFGWIFVAKGASVDAFSATSPNPVLASEMLSAPSSNSRFSHPSDRSSTPFSSLSWMRTMENARIRQRLQDRQAIREELVERAEQWLCFQEHSGKSPIVSVSWVVSGFLRLGFEPTDPFLAPRIAWLRELAATNGLDSSDHLEKSGDWKGEMAEGLEFAASQTSGSKTSSKESSETQPEMPPETLPKKLSEEERGAIRYCLTLLATLDVETDENCRDEARRGHEAAPHERRAVANEPENGCGAENGQSMSMETFSSMENLPGASPVGDAVNRERASNLHQSSSLTESVPSSVSTAMAPKVFSAPLISHVFANSSAPTAESFVPSIATLASETVVDSAEIQSRLQRVTLFLRRGWTIPSDRESRTSLALMGTYSEKEPVTVSITDIQTLANWGMDAGQLVLQEELPPPLAPASPAKSPLWVVVAVGTTSFSSRPILSLCEIASCKSNTVWDHVLADSRMISTGYVTMIQTTLRRE